MNTNMRTFQYIACIICSKTIEVEYPYETMYKCMYESHNGFIPMFLLTICSKCISKNCVSYRYESACNYVGSSMVMSWSAYKNVCKYMGSTPKLEGDGNACVVHPLMSVMVRLPKPMSVKILAMDNELSVTDCDISTEPFFVFE